MSVESIKYNCRNTGGEGDTVLYKKKKNVDDTSERVANCRVPKHDF